MLHLTDTSPRPSFLGNSPRVTERLSAGNQADGSMRIPADHHPEKILVNSCRAPFFSKPGHSLIQAKAWQSSMAARKWVFEPLKGIISLLLNCCLNSGSHKLCYSCFIKKQGWWAICLTHYTEGPKATVTQAFQTGWPKPRMAECMLGRVPMERGGVHQTLIRGSSSPFQVSLQSWIREWRNEKEGVAIDFCKATQKSGEGFRTSKGYFFFF